jgi:CheY-like chemotaxis protein
MVRCREHRSQKIMPKKILLADDSITIQKVVELTFSDGDYEVVAVNNGARAIDKLGEMRPDIILSDIIMPEKNGYEVCEYVKSQPSLRSIPVILLTGTFEPFDPDRAEKAGCDAVVTKPFESQNLIHKVEELIASAAQQAPEPEPTVEAPPPPVVDMSGETRAWHIPSMTPAYEPPAEPVSPFAAPPSFSTQEAPFEMPLPESPSLHEAPTDVFETPVGEAFEGETRAFPALGFEPPPPAPAPLFGMGEPEPPPPFEPPALDLGAESGVPPALEFDRVPTEKQHAIPEEPAPAAPVFGLGEPEEQQYSAETRAFPAMSFDQLQAIQQESAPTGEPLFEAPAEEPLAAPPQDEIFGGETAEPAFSSAETRAFPAMSFDQLQAIQQESAVAPEPEPEAAWSAPAEEPAWSAPEPEPQPAAEPEWAAPAAEEPAPAWGAPAEEPAWGAPEPEPEPQPAAEPEWAAPAAEEPAPAWGAPAEEPAWGGAEPEPEPELQPAAEPEWAAPAWDDKATRAVPAIGLDESALHEPAPEPAPAWSAPAVEEEPAAPAWTAPAEAEPAWSAPAEEPVETAPADEPAAAWIEPAAQEPAAAIEPEPEPEPVPAFAPAAPVIAAAAASLGTGELTQAQIDAIARRVVEMMSDEVVRKIAWEVVPELADMIVRDRIRELEGAD